MSLFKPSNLSPNFESVTTSKPLTITFQVNSNGSTVNAYRVQILKDTNSKDDSEDNVIGSVYGAFDTPLYNKDIGEIILEEETLKYNGIVLEPNKDYRWTLRLYGEDKRKSGVAYEDVPVEINSNNCKCAIDFSKDFYITLNNTDRINFESEDYILLVSQEDISGILSNLLYSNEVDNQGYIEVNEIEDLYDMISNYSTKFFKISASDLNELTTKSKDLSGFIHPKMWFYQIYVGIAGASSYYIYLDGEKASSLNVFTLSYYKINWQETYSKNLTYIGSGNLVGSTKQVMWSTQYNDSMKLNSYARLLWTTAGCSYFQPFEFDSQTVSWSNGDNAYSLRISADGIKQNYIKNLTDGNCYVLLTNSKLPYNTSSAEMFENSSGYTELKNNLRKIVSVKFLNDSNKYELFIHENETFPNKDVSGYSYLTLVYIQQQKIIQVDKNIGNNNLTKISFEESFEFNPLPIDGQYLHLGYVNDDFDYDRFYINPVEEFDNSNGFSYIILGKSSSSMSSEIDQTALDKLLISTDETKKGYKIINYVEKTGEVTIYNKAKNLPTIQTYYHIYKRKKDDDTKYTLLTSGWLGGTESATCDIVKNSIEQIMVSGSESVSFDNLFIQPNIGIKQDDYMPMKLNVYNEKYSKDIYLTNYYNGYDSIGKKNIEKLYNIKSVDTLDDTMWRVITKNIEDQNESLAFPNENYYYVLYEPQTQYKIYTNFVDSIPEGFFYSRYDKTINFEIYDLNTYGNENQNPYIFKNGKLTYDSSVVDAVPYRDLYIKAICQDYKLENNEKYELGTNYVTLKEYHFEIMTVDQKIIYSTNEKYDGKFSCEFRGCNNDSIYYIKSYVEDDYGKLYTYQAKIPIKYNTVVSNTNITTSILCEEQAVKIDFMPVRQIENNGTANYEDNYTCANFDGSFEFSDYGDNNSVSIPSDFSYYVKFKLDSGNVSRNSRIKIFEVISDEGQKCILYFDTQPYFIDKDGKYTINNTYMKFILSLDEIENNINISDGDTKKCFDIPNNVTNNSFIIPNKFAYVMQNSNEVKNNYIYIIAKSTEDIADKDRTDFITTIPDVCIEGTTLKLVNDSTLYYVLSNNEQFIDNNKEKMSKITSPFVLKLTVKNNKIEKATITIEE